MIYFTISKSRKEISCPHWFWEVSRRNSRFPVPCAFFSLLQLLEEPLLQLQTPHLGQTGGKTKRKSSVSKSVAYLGASGTGTGNLKMLPGGGVELQSTMRHAA